MGAFPDAAGTAVRALPRRARVSGVGTKSGAHVGELIQSVLCGCFRPPATLSLLVPSEENLSPSQASIVTLRTSRNIASAFPVAVLPTGSAHRARLRKSHTSEMSVQTTPPTDHCSTRNPASSRRSGTVRCNDARLSTRDFARLANGAVELLGRIELNALSRVPASS